MIYKKESSIQIEKNGVAMRLYTEMPKHEGAALVYQETDTGHHEEFFHEKSTFIYYIVDGAGTWIIEDVPHNAQKGDVVVIPPGTRFYFIGKLKQLCITTPAWDPAFEKHVRTVTI